MRESFSHFLNHLKYPQFPELGAFFILLVLLWMFGLSPLYATIVGLLGLLGISVFILSLYHPHKFTTSASVVVLLTVTTGLLQFNYIPSLAIWLLIIVRLVFVNTKMTISLVLLTVFTALVSLLTVNFLLPKLVITPRHQDILNFGVVFVTVLIVAYQLRMLIVKLRSTKLALQAQQQRIDTLVSVTNKLTRFLPPQIWQPILKSNTKVEVVNQRRKLTILFSDIVGFTALSDNISPDHLANILNTYFDRMTQVTQKYGATLDKFWGDGLLCYFGDTGTSNDRDNAINCASMAIEMRREMAVLRQQWRLLGFDGLYVRIGINTGYCYVGNFGSRNRMTYTVIGKEANFASRLESTAKQNQILISESTYHLISHVHNCKSVGQLSFKGFQEAVTVWELLDPAQNSKGQSDWVDFNLPGFNLHLNFHDIRNYDQQTIMRHLHDALQIVEKKKQQP